MRLLFAGLFVLGGLCFVSNVLFAHFSPRLAGVMLLPAVCFLVLAILVLFNLGRKVRQDPRTFEERMREKEAKGLLVKTDHKSHRAFEVEEFEDEGAHFFVEVEDGSVLYLNGQYLYEYLPTDKQPRTFPCTEFTMIRNKENGLVEDIQCRGTALEPEVTCPVFSKAYFKNGPVWTDGDVIRDRTYDQLKAELMKG